MTAFVELMQTDPATAEPLLLKMLADPHATQLLAELVATHPNGRSTLLKMSTYSSALEHAFTKLITKIN